jgi:hypothetical protein
LRAGGQTGRGKRILSTTGVAHAGRWCLVFTSADTHTHTHTHTCSCCTTHNALHIPYSLTHVCIITTLSGCYAWRR